MHLINIHRSDINILGCVPQHKKCICINKAGKLPLNPFFSFSGRLKFDRGDVYSFSPRIPMHTNIKCMPNKPMF